MNVRRQSENALGRLRSLPNIHLPLLYRFRTLLDFHREDSCRDRSRQPFPHPLLAQMHMRSFLGVRLGGPRGSQNLLVIRRNGKGTGLATLTIALAVGNGLSADWHQACLLASLCSRFRPPEFQTSSQSDSRFQSPSSGGRCAST